MRPYATETLHSSGSVPHESKESYGCSTNEKRLPASHRQASTLRALGYAAVTAAGGGGNFATKLDLGSAHSTLGGADVVAIVDKDDTGARWKEQVTQTLTPFVQSLTFIQAADEAHDASDAAMSGLEFEILPNESSQSESESGPAHRAYSLTRLADVEPEHPLWLWPGHIPKGKIVLIDGDPATGKSTLALDIAAHVTTGAAWPDGSAGCEPANVLLLTAEDGLADIVSPRIRAAQGDASKMFVLSEVFKDGKEITITLTDALPQIAQAVREQHIGLIVVDVLMSFFGQRHQQLQGSGHPRAGDGSAQKAVRGNRLHGCRVAASQ